MSREKIGGPQKDKPQYYYFYGSTDSVETMDNVNHPSRPAGPASPTNDQDSLAGECLVHTDTEHEDENPTISARDHAHVVLMNGSEVKPLVVNGGSTPSNGRHHRRRSRRYKWLSFWVSWRNRHPIVHISLLVLTLAVFLFVLSVVVYPDSKAAYMAQSPKSDILFKMPFPSVDRARFNDPISNFIVKDLFHPSLLYKGSDPSREFVFPFPTGAFWTNLVLNPTPDRGLSYPIAVYPYAFKWSDELLQASYPAFHRQEEPKAIHDYFFPDLTFGGGENTVRRYITAFDPLSVTLQYKTASGFWETYLVQGSPYVTIQYQNVSPKIHALSIFKDVFCPGGEDGSINFDGKGRQRRRKLMFGVCSTENSDDGSSTILRGVQFILQSNEGMTWLVFASEPITLIFDQQTKTTVSSQEKFKGVLRFAYIPHSPTATDGMAAEPADVKISASSGLQRLVYHAGVYPTAGSVSWSFRPAAASDKSNLLKSNAAITGLSSLSSSSSSSESSTKSATGSRIGSVHFDYTTRSFSPPSSATSTKALLMLALPHHAQSLPANSLLTNKQFDLVYRCIKGPMTPVLGSSWDYDEILPNLGFDGGTGADSMESLRDPNVHEAITKSLKQDIDLALPTLTENVYGFGKQAARLAQIAHIANSLHQTRNKTMAAAENDEVILDLLDRAVDLLSSLLTNFLTGRVSDSLVFDANLGGLVTSDGLLDSGADFGNGRYNDHHFHYGYLLYACAIMGNLNNTFVEKYGDHVDAILFDVAFESNLDSKNVGNVFFPSARHKIWFDGHSFASGLFPFGNGKSQESSSEAVNCYYGAYLWSLVRHGYGSDPGSDLSEQTDFVRLLLAMEIRGARLYWHMSPPVENSTSTDSSPAIYSPAFSKNYMVGNLGMLDAICSTWFGTQSLYVHMINFIPVTSVTGELFSPLFVSKELAHTFPPHTEVEMAWRGFVVSDTAIVDANKAWRDAEDLFSPELDSGLSKSQVLYWIATRAGFSPANITHHQSAEPGGTKPSNTPGSDSMVGTCEQNQACSEKGLMGECCPTPGGAFLDCCDSN